MPYLRQRQKIPATGRVAIKLTPAQRDQLIESATLSRGLGKLLHRAAVKQGKLYVRLTGPELDALILSAVGIPTPNLATKRAIDIFLGYLEAQADRFDSADREDPPVAQQV